jgi:peptide/nickel transport system substrate-binding protein
MMVFVVREGSPLQSRQVRLAMNHAIDKDAIVKYLVSGAGVVATQMGVRGSEGFDPSLKAIAYDPERARALLREAGYPNGIDLEMDLLVVTNTDRAVFEAILADLRDVGVRITVHTMEFERWRAKLLAGDWQHDLFSFTVALDPLLDITKAWQYLTCERDNAPFCQPEVSELIETRARTFDQSERDRLLRLAHEKMTIDPPVILVHEMEQITAYRDLENLQVDNLMIRWDQLRKRSSSSHD